MTETEKLYRDIETLRESIQLMRMEESCQIDFLPETARQSYRVQISILQTELASLFERLWREGDD